MALMVRRPAIALTVVLALLVAALAYLRDPPWLIGIESGLRGWQTGTDGVRYRWTDGHASFFVPASAPRLTIPARVTFDDRDDPPVLVSIAIDDRPADAFELRDDRWLTRTLVMPPPGGRRVRRIDIRVDRVRSGNRGIQLGEVEHGR
jgi:hypothetical protein